MQNFGKSTRWKNGRITRHLIITYFKSRIFGWVFGPDRSNWYKCRDPKICYSSVLPFFFPRVGFPKFFRSSLFLGVPVFTSVNFRKRWTIIIETVKENENSNLYKTRSSISTISLSVNIEYIYLRIWFYIFSFLLNSNVQLCLGADPSHLDVGVEGQGDTGTMPVLDYQDFVIDQVFYHGGNYNSFKGRDILQVYDLQI